VAELPADKVKTAEPWWLLSVTFQIDRARKIKK